MGTQKMLNRKAKRGVVKNGLQGEEHFKSITWRGTEEVVKDQLKMIRGEVLMASFSTRRGGHDDDNDVKCNYEQYLYQGLLCNC